MNFNKKQMNKSHNQIQYKKKMNYFNKKQMNK